MHCILQLLGGLKMGKILTKEFLSENKKRLFLIILAVAILSITAVGYVLTFNQVTIMDGEEEWSIKTRKETVQEVLEDQGISYIKEDAIMPSLDSKIEDEITIVIKRAVDIIIKSDEKTYELLTPVEDVAAAIEQAGITLGEKDYIVPALNEKLKQGMKIEIARAVPCYIQADGQKIDLLTTASSVQDAIEEAQLTLGDMDKISPALNETIQEDTIIKIIRVTEQTETLVEEINFKTIKQNANDMNKGTTKITTKGIKGEKEKQIKITYEDDKEVKREILEEKIIKEPVDQVVKVGTKALPSVQTNRGGEVNRRLTVTATAYSVAQPSLSRYTANGTDLHANPRVIAVDPKVIPLGTKVNIRGYGTYIAADIGTAIKGNRIDIHFPTVQECKRFGVRTVTIEIYGR